jgi:tetrahydromethanopterin S-methyltransferase subunit G
MEVELTERVGKLEVTVGRHEERLEKVEEYQERQNGSLQRLEEKMDALNKWLIGLLGGVITSLILLLINLSLGQEPDCPAEEESVRVPGLRLQPLRQREEV